MAECITALRRHNSLAILSETIESTNCAIDPPPPSPPPPPLLARRLILVPTYPRSYMNSSLYEKDLECRHSLTLARSFNSNGSLMTINIFKSEFMWKVKASRNNETIRSNLSKLCLNLLSMTSFMGSQKIVNVLIMKRIVKCKQKELVNYVK